MAEYYVQVENALVPATARGQRAAPELATKLPLARPTDIEPA
jgi:hypothetical protein